MNKPIIINNFQKGVSLNPATGFEAIVNCDINTNPGTVYPNFAPAKESGAIFTNLVSAIAGNYALDDDGVIATFAGSEIANRPHNYDNGLAWWKGYLFHIGNTHIDTWITGTGWNTSWGGDAKEASSPAFSYVASNDDKLYIASGRYLYSLEENVGQTFDPTNNATFTKVSKALSLPDGYVIKAISEIGSSLAILANKDSYNGALFLWDTVSTSFECILFNEPGQQMIAFNGLLYLNMGFLCSFYISNGSSVSGPYNFPLSSLDNNLNDAITSQLSFKPNAIEVIKNKIFFGLGAVSSTVLPKGIYSFNPLTKDFQCENIISTGTTNDITVGVIKKVNTNSPYVYRYGYGDYTSGSPNYGIDKISITNRVSNYNAYIISPFYIVGTKLEQKTFQHIQIKFRKPANGAYYNVRIAYRKNRKYNIWETIDTTNINETNLTIDYFVDFAVSTVGIQFKISFHGHSDTMAELEEIRIE